MELQIYSIDLNSTPTTQGLEGCPQRCSCRSSNTSENITSNEIYIKNILTTGHQVALEWEDLTFNLWWIINYGICGAAKLRGFLEKNKIRFNI